MDADRVTGGAEARLASYGSLAPGESNHRELAALPGRWVAGHVRGRLIEAGWGAWIGYPGLVLDPAGEQVDVQVFESAELPEHWDRLDAFEGEAYLRVEVDVVTAEGPLPASIYVLTGHAVREGKARLP